MSSDTTSYLLRSFAHYKRKTRSEPTLVQRGVQTLTLTPSDFPDIRLVTPLQVEGRFLKGIAENATQSNDLTEQYTLEVCRTGHEVTQLASYNTNGVKKHEVKFFGELDHTGVPLIVNREPKKKTPDVFTRNELNIILYEPGMPEWYRLSTAETMCVLENRQSEQQQDTSVSILYPDFSQISFSTRVNRVTKIENVHILHEKILPTLSICKGLISFIKSEEDLLSEHRRSERSTVVALFLWKTIQNLLIKLDRVHARLQTSISDKQEEAADYQKNFDLLHTLVKGQTTNYFEAFLEPFEQALSQAKNLDLEADNEQHFLEALQIIKNIRSGFESWATGLESTSTRTQLARLVAAGMKDFPASDSCFDGLVRYWLTGTNCFIDTRLYEFVISHYKLLLDLNEQSKPLSDDPLTKLLEQKVFSNTDGLCSTIASTINSTTRFHTDITLDLCPKTSDSATNQKLLELSEQPLEVAGGGFNFGSFSMKHVYEDWVIKRQQNCLVAFSSSSLHRVDIATDAEIHSDDLGKLTYNSASGLFLAVSIRTLEDGTQTSQISWLDSNWLAEAEKNKVSTLSFKTHPEEFIGAVVISAYGNDGYVICQIYIGVDSQNYLVKLGENSVQITDFELMARPKMIVSFFKGKHFLVLEEDNEYDRFLTEKSGQKIKQRAYLFRINESNTVEKTDQIEVSIFPDSAKLTAVHRFNSRTGITQRFSKFDFFNKGQTKYMLVFNSAPAVDFSLWRLKNDTKFELVTNFASIAKKINRYLIRSNLGVLDMTGLHQLNSSQSPLSMLLLLIEHEEKHTTVESVVARPIPCEIKIKCVKIDVRLL